MLSASCSWEDLDESYRLLDHPEKYENGFIAFQVTVQIIAREENAREKVNCNKFIPWPID